MSNINYTFYVDGACSGNPGPMGCGIIASCEMGGKQFSREYSIPLGEGTNQKAELLAVKNALLKVPENHRQVATVTIITDSKYAIGCLSQGWNVKANATITNEVKEVMAQFKDLKFQWVKGHEKNENNNRADVLGVAASQNQDTTTAATTAYVPSEEIDRALWTLTKFMEETAPREIQGDLRARLIQLRSKLQRI